MGSSALGASQAALVVKNLLPMQESRVSSLSGEDPLEEEMATRSSILAWRIPWTEEPGGLQSVGSLRVGHNLVTKHRPRRILLVIWPHEGGLLGLL